MSVPQIQEYFSGRSSVSSRGAMVQIAHSTVRTLVFGSQVWFGFSTRFYIKTFFFSQNDLFILLKVA